MRCAWLCVGPWGCCLLARLSKEGGVVRPLPSGRWRRYRRYVDGSGCYERIRRVIAPRNICLTTFPDGRFSTTRGLIALPDSFLESFDYFFTTGCPLSCSKPQNHNPNKVSLGGVLDFLNTRCRETRMSVRPCHREVFDLPETRFLTGALRPVVVLPIAFGKRQTQ